MQIGTYLIKTSAYSVEERLRMTRAAGFDFVCFGMQSMCKGTGATPELCAKIGIGYDNVHLTGEGTHQIWAEGEEGEAIADRYCRELALCDEYDVRTAIVHVTWGTKPPPPLSETGLRRLTRIADCAEQHRVTLAIENSAFIDYISAVMDRLSGRPFVGYCFDSGHRNAFAPDCDLLRHYGGLLAATHLQDNDGRRDLHLLPMDGCVPWEEVARGLAATAFAREKICAEVAPSRTHVCTGQSAEDIRRDLSRVAILDDPNLLHIEDGSFTTYPGLSYEAMLDRLMRAMRTIARMIEAAE